MSSIVNFGVGDVVIFKDMICVVKEVKKSPLGFNEYIVHDDSCQKSYVASKLQLTQVLELFDDDFEEMVLKNLKDDCDLTQVSTENDTATTDKVETGNIETESDVSDAPVSFEPMPKCFRTDTKERMEHLAANRTSKHTDYQTIWAVRMLTDWLQESGLNTAFENDPVSSLNEMLAQFYASVSPQGEKGEYSKSSYRNIRNGINRYLTSPPYSRAINIIQDRDFQASNQVYQGILNTLREEGKDTSEHKSPITTSDMDKMYSTLLFNHTPWGLLYKVFFELSFHFARRGREGLKSLKKNSYIFEIDENAVEYVRAAYHEKEKTKTGLERHIKEKDAVMYSQPGEPERCPVLSLRLLLSKLNPECDSLFQYPKRRWEMEDSAVWYENRPLGKNSLGTLMKEISKKANLSQIYTNHYIRATSITVLAQNGIDSANITSVSGHKSIESLKHYISGPSMAQKKQMSSILHTSTKGKIINPGRPSCSGASPSVGNCEELEMQISNPPCCSSDLQLPQMPAIALPEITTPSSAASDWARGMFMGANITGNININISCASNNLR